LSSAVLQQPTLSSTIAGQSTTNTLSDNVEDISNISEECGVSVDTYIDNIPVTSLDEGLLSEEERGSLDVSPARSASNDDDDALEAVVLTEVHESVEEYEEYEEIDDEDEENEDNWEVNEEHSNQGTGGLGMFSCHVCFCVE